MNAEYVDDLPYLRQFVPELSPARLRLVAALNGVTPPPAMDFDYCEIGCGHGDTLAALAAAHPWSRFIGIDISAAHVASARRLTRDGSLENIGILERDFSTLAYGDVPQLDYLAAHGLLTWISPEKRRALIELASAKLKPGGLLHVSYNSMPGWASVEPLRRLLRFGAQRETFAADAGGATSRGEGGRSGEQRVDAARRGVELARALRIADAGYFVKNPAASEMLDTMVNAGLRYIVHEYLNEHWHPMYFADVAAEMHACDLHFVGNMPLLLNFPDAALTDAHERLFGAVTDRLAFESVKDFALNEFFRRDVYVKGNVPRSDGATQRYFDETPWGTIASALPASGSVRLPHRTVTLQGATFHALFAALSEGAATLLQLAQRTAALGVSVTPQELRPALVRLAMTDYALPMCTATRRWAGAKDARFAVPALYNQTMLRRLSIDAPIVLVSAAAGTAFPISALEGVALRALTEVAPADRERWVHDLVARSFLRIRVADRVLDEPHAQRAAVLDAIEQVCTLRLPKLVELGILEPA